jgi:PAS domain S-box-containing protein
MPPETPLISPRAAPPPSGFRALIALLFSAACLAATDTPRGDLFDLARPSILDCGLEVSVGRTSIHALMLDSRGRLWAGTQNGAAFLAGEGWTAFPLPREAPSRFVRSLLETRDGSLWFGTDDGGIWRLHQRTWTHFAGGRELPVARINCLVEIQEESRGHRLLAGTMGGGVLSFDGQRWSPFPMPAECRDRNIWNIRQWTDEAGTSQLWIAGDEGLCLREHGQWRNLGKPQGFHGTNVNDVALLKNEQGESSVWGSFWGRGVARWDGRRWELTGPGQGFTSSFPTCLAVTEKPDGGRLLWAGTYDSGIFCWNGRSWSRLDTSAELPNQSVYALQANPGRVPDLWVGGRAGGLVSVNLHGWRHLEAGSAFPHLFATCLLETPPLRDGSTFWIGSNAGILRWDGRNLTREGAAQGLPSTYVVDLKTTPGRDGPEVWAGTLKGMARRANGRWIALGRRDGLPEVRVNTLLPSRDAHGGPALWAGFEGWLCRWERGRWTAVGREQGLPHGAIYALAETEDGPGHHSLWVGFRGGGVYRFRDGVWTSYGAKRGLPDATVNTFATTRSPDGRRWLWAGTLGRGLGRLDMDNPAAQWELVDTEREPRWPNDVVYRLEQDAAGNLYATTGWGVVRIGLGGPAGGPVAFRPYSLGDGLPSSAGVPGASTVDGLGRIWVGTARGAAVMDPRQAEDPLKPTGPFLESLELDDRAIDPAGILLDHHPHHLRARYQLLTFHRREDIRFRTQVAGRDPEPGDWTREARRELTGLASGSYCLKIWAKDALGNVYGPLELPFSVRPAPWLRWWAYAAYGLLLAAATLGIVHLRTQQSLDRQRRLERTVAERTRELNRQAEVLRQTNLELEQTTAEVRTSQARLRAIFDSAGIGIALVDVDGRYIQFNDFWAEMLGCSRDEVLALRNIDVTHPEDRAASQERLQALIRGEIQGYELEKRFVRRDGLVFWADLSATAIRTPEGDVEAIVGLVSDISEKKRNRDLLLAAKGQAEAATHAKSEFLTNMSHEIRTPMNAIMGLSHLALRTELNPKQQDYLTRILASSRMLLRILNDILDISKIEAGKLEIEQVDFNLQSVLKHVQDLVSLRAEEKGLALDFELSEDVPLALVGDPLRLGQVLLNLTANAVKFTERGSVRVRIHVQDRRDSQISLRFEVQDSGIGISPDALARLFLPFSQADTSTTRRFGGSGLGLAISKRLVEMMGGEIAAESVPGGGSTFAFTVPLSLQPASPELGAVLPSGSSAPRHSQVRILLAEDNETNRLVTQELLEASGCQIEMATSGREAVDKALAPEAAYDLILMDVQMPEMDGLEATARIRAAGETLPILAMTAHAMETERQRCLDAGMNDHLPKPFEPELLQRALERWIPAISPQAVPAASKTLSTGFDPAKLLAQFKGDRGKAGLILQALGQDLSTQRESLRAAVVAADPAHAARTAHTLKGLGSVLGTDLQARALKLESAIREEAPWQNLARELELHLDGLLAPLEAGIDGPALPPKDSD